MSMFRLFMSISWYQSLVCLCFVRFNNLRLSIKNTVSFDILKFLVLEFFFYEKYGQKSLGDEISNILVF